MQVSVNQPSRQSLRDFRKKIHTRLESILRRYSVLCYLIPKAKDLSLPQSLSPALLSGETKEQYRLRVTKSFLRRAAVLKRDISAYFFYKQQNDNQAIFEFVDVAPLRLALQEPWVFDHLMYWYDVGDERSIRKLFGRYRGKRSQQHQDERQALFQAVRVKVEQVRQETGWPIQKILDELAKSPIRVILDEGPLEKMNLNSLYFDCLEAFDHISYIKPISCVLWAAGMSKIVLIHSEWATHMLPALVASELRAALLRKGYWLSLPQNRLRQHTNIK